ncbi:MAG: hypothetical protein JW965_08215 [Bacteroidales bacterium]|nr:hypothetical protein [Bacteroidales bacterium]
MGRKIFLLSMLTFCLTSTILSQIRPELVVDLRRLQIEFEQAKCTEGMGTPVYEGTPYLLDSFTTANIILKEGQGYQDIPMNYNIHNDDFEFMIDSVSYTLGNNDIVNYINIDGRNFYYMSYTYNSAEIRGYLELIADGGFRFFKKHRVIYTEPQQTTGYKEAQPPEFSPRSPDYFIELGDGSILFFNKLDDIADLVPGESKRIKDYIKDKKLKARREEDIIELADFLNEK